MLNWVLLFACGIAISIVISIPLVISIVLFYRYGSKQNRSSGDMPRLWIGVIATLVGFGAFPHLIRESTLIAGLPTRVAVPTLAFISVLSTGVAMVITISRTFGWT